MLFFNLDLAHESADYCDDVKGKLADIGVTISELSTHFQGQMVSVHPAYDAMFGGQRPADLRGNSREAAPLGGGAGAERRWSAGASG